MPLSSGRPTDSDDRAVDPDVGDRELIRRLTTGDATALDDLVLSHWSSVVAYAARMLDGSDLSEDIAQETFLRLWEHRASWTPAESLRPLLYRITRNLALNERRRRRVRERSVEKASRVAAPRGPTPVEVVEEEELRTRVEAAIDRLPARRREVFVLARFHNLSFREIAEVMGISPQTVANQMSSALSDLQTALHPFLEQASGFARGIERRSARGGGASTPVHAHS